MKPFSRYLIRTRAPNPKRPILVAWSVVLSQPGFLFQARESLNLTALTLGRAEDGVKPHHRPGLCRLTLQNCGSVLDSGELVTTTTQADRGVSGDKPGWG